MKFYVQGSQFFDATLVPSQSGQPQVTITGWIVYSWTAIYIAWMLFAGLEHGFHLAQIMKLRPNEIPYAPFHADGGAGVRFIMEPSLNVGYALIGLLTTFVVFIIHDRIIYHIESNRLLGFAIYVLVALPMFGLPFLKLHQLMKARRDEYLFDSLDESLSAARSAGERKDWNGLVTYLAAVESADKYRKIVCTLPIWPVPIAPTLPSLGSIAAAIFPLIQKIIFNPPTALSLFGQ
jgi:hypothetical protein